MKQKQELGFFEKPLSYVILSVITAITILNQGGYFAGGIVLAGILLSLCLVKSKSRISHFDLSLLLFSVWYLVCAVIPGFDIDFTARAALPLLMFLFFLVIGTDKENSAKLLDTVIKIALVLAGIAVIMGVVELLSSMRLPRVDFPLHYANTTGILFGVMFLLAGHGNFKAPRALRYLFLAALLLTQSVGAIELILSKSLKKTLVYVVVLALGAFLLKDRVIQSMGTFVERLLQMHDAFLCMLKHPLFGIGAGRWETQKQLYQTGFYNTIEIHSSVMSIGAASGIIGLCLFLASAVCGFLSMKFEHKVYPICVAVLLLHGLLDFSFAFLCIGFLLAIILAQGEDRGKQRIRFPVAARVSVSVVMLISFITLACGLSAIKTYKMEVAEQRFSHAVSAYEHSFLLNHSFEATVWYAKALQMTGKAETFQTLIETIDVLPLDMIVMQQQYEEDWRSTLNYLKQQPYNSYLYDAMETCEDETLRAEATSLFSEAIDNLSPLGKILYKIEGEKQS